MAVIAASPKPVAKRPRLTYARRQALWGYLLVAPGLPPAARARRLPVLLRDLHLVHQPRRRRRRRVGRAWTTSATSLKWSSFDAGRPQHDHPRRRLRRAQARHRARAGAAAQRADPGPRPLPLVHPAAVGDARVRRLPRLAAALPADRRRDQPRSSTETGLHTGIIDWLGPEIDRDAGRHHRHRLARLPLLVHLLPGRAPDRAAGTLRGGQDRRRQRLAAVLAVTLPHIRHVDPRRHPALLDLDGQLASRTSGS